MIYKSPRRKSDGCGEEILWFAAGWEKQQLAFVDKVCIVDGRVRLCDAGPESGVAELSLRDLRERVALAHGEFCRRPESRDHRRQVNLGACHDVVGVNDARINGEQVAPAETFAEVLLREFPEGVPRLHRHDI